MNREKTIDSIANPLVARVYATKRSVGLFPFMGEVLPGHRDQ